jgi:hypothetical protein
MVRIYFIDFVLSNIKKSLFLYRYGDLKVYTSMVEIETPRSKCGFGSAQPP